MEEEITRKITQLFNDPGQVKVTLFQKHDNNPDDFALVKVSATITHPELDNVGVEFTFRIPKL